MSKAYLLVVTNNFTTHGAFIDLDKLPQGANSNEVAHFAAQGTNLVDWLYSNINEAASIADNIRNGKFDSEVLAFISKVASLFENMPPSDQERDIIIGVRDGKVDLMRVTEEFAKNTWIGFSNLKGKSA